MLLSAVLGRYCSMPARKNGSRHPSRSTHGGAGEGEGFLTQKVYETLICTFRDGTTAVGSPKAGPDWTPADVTTFVFRRLNVSTRTASLCPGRTRKLFST